MSTQQTSPNYYELLGVNRSATQGEVKAAYHRLILKYHPDRNPDPKATEYAQLLNEAHGVLCDERKRQLYDQWLQANHIPPNEKASAKSEPSAPDFCCSKCGIKNSSLRLVAMYYVISPVFVTYRRAASGVWCEKCRAREAAKWTFLSAVLGWWGFPWGPIYTLQALFVNAKGGLQSASNNAALLRAVAYQLYTRGELDEAASALKQSLRLEDNAAALDFLKYLVEQNHAAPKGRPFWGWQVGTAAPSAASLAVIAILIGLMGAIQPSGYCEEYKTPPDLAASTKNTRSPTFEECKGFRYGYSMAVKMKDKGFSRDEMEQKIDSVLADPAFRKQMLDTFAKQRCKDGQTDDCISADVTDDEMFKLINEEMRLEVKEVWSNPTESAAYFVAARGCDPEPLPVQAEK